MAGREDKKGRRIFLKQSLAMGAMATLPFGAAAYAGGRNLMEGSLDKIRKGNGLLESRPFNGPYWGPYLNKVAFPIGGIGAGMFCMEGTGAISHLSVRNRPEIYNEPYAFAAISVKGLEKGAKVLEAPVPGWKLFGPQGSGNGSGNRSYGLPRFESGRFLARFPFAQVELLDPDIPLEVEITGWSPFIPNDADNSSLPSGALEYRFRNTSDVPVGAVFSYNARNFIDEQGRITPEKGGFRLLSDKANSSDRSGFSIYTDSPEVVVDHCWFRGAWFDPQTILWKHIQQGDMVSNPPVEGTAPGASLYIPVSLPVGGEKTIRVYFSWYLPETNLAFGIATASGKAFREKPSSGTASGQQQVEGFQGRHLVNTFDPSGDNQTGILESPVIRFNKRYLKFLAGGGNDPEKTAVQLVVNGNVVETSTGNNTERLIEKIWDLKAYRNKSGFIRIIDKATGPWGHILADQFVLTDDVSEDLSQPTSKALLIADFEEDGYGNWKQFEVKETEGFEDEQGEPVPFYRPWYAQRFKNLDEVVAYWLSNVDELRKKSELFRDAFYASTLPAEVTEAIAANLTILKSPTLLRQYNGKLWGWEGCNDSSGCCAGSCTHVWNYAQAIPHLFPALERSLRETEFNVSQNEEGHQVFRASLPISKAVHDFHSAADGQLGGLMKLYREWRISGNTNWMKELYPKARKSIDYCIKTWDPRHLGVLEEPHHNTYDIEFWGPDGMCTSFYLGALTAIIEMSRALGEPYDLYESLLEKGKKAIETDLFDGEYFIQKIKWTGLQAPDPVKAQSFNTQYSEEALKILQTEGPKYQYGKGCLSDGILGMWIASVCGLKEIIDEEKVRSHLVAVHKYNLKEELTDHDNPQRPSFACGADGGLLLCTWPKGGRLSLPFVYSNEVWTGIEYQVASHLMMKGEVEKGLEIVRACRERYDGILRNPFDEYECGHWYARAMSSYGMLQGLTGVRYDAVDQILFVDSKIGDFTSFLSVEGGYGNVGLKQGKPFLNVAQGKIIIKKFVVSGKEFIP